MKDSEARKSSRDNLLAIGYLNKRIEELEENKLEIKDCPKCKHPAPAWWTLYSKEGCIGMSPSIFSCYQCLTCGTKFKCTQKNVCELIEEKK